MQELIEAAANPDLADWEASPEEQYYVYENEQVRAIYEKIGMEKSPLSVFYIIKNHYKQRMEDIVKHINYFLTFYDHDKESFLSILSVKFVVDSNPCLSQKSFRALVLDRIITEPFVSKCKQMANDLYQININTDKEGKYKNTPKITNGQAKQIVALSFCFRIILPLCIHYSNVSVVFQTKEKTQYLECFDKIFTRIVERFEENDIHIYTALCNFIQFRVEKAHNNNKLIWYQKKQIRGDSPELYTEELMHKVILVKSLYKLDYQKSCVSFIDGVVNSFNINYSRENYASKPYEIDSADASRESDDYLSHAEALEMSVYKIDESNAMINDINIQRTLEQIERNFHNIPLTEEELDFYNESCKFNEITQFLLHTFYSKKFHDSYAIYGLNREATIRLLIYMKKYFALAKMPLISQICTAKIKGKYKDNLIKNSKFIEKLSLSPVYQDIIRTKFRYLKELDSKDDPILRKMSAFVNCVFEFVDPNPELNGYVLEDIDVDEIIHEVLLFLSIA